MQQVSCTSPPICSPGLDPVYIHPNVAANMMMHAHLRLRPVVRRDARHQSWYPGQGVWVAGRAWWGAGPPAGFHAVCAGLCHSSSTYRQHSKGCGFAIQTGRQTDRQTDIPTNIHTDTHTLTHSYTYIHTCKHRTPMQQQQQPHQIFLLSSVTSFAQSFWWGQGCHSG